MPSSADRASCSCVASSGRFARQSFLYSVNTVSRSSVPGLAAVIRHVWRSRAMICSISIFQYARYQWINPTIGSSFSSRRRIGNCHSIRVIPLGLDLASADARHLHDGLSGALARGALGVQVLTHGAFLETRALLHHEAQLASRGLLGNAFPQCRAIVTAWFRL